jgi:hypothetical protein
MRMDESAVEERGTEEWLQPIRKRIDRCDRITDREDH